ncbi:DUF1858 domain-containing protein [Amorphus orientalis]|uniref:Hybrid cluster-associated redox disulfide protein n=1 Tax=Amorphus orientalis TaxID=649198 RepID=A0AAE3VN77_9HYPH|nr:DUF1858 domain-containing protein [Amorphus orientalis]MDQ0315018.1 hybrid cluster-associated redox disulfide protein [Amorphus orientalis]
MTDPCAVGPDMVLDDLMRTWPATIGVLIRYRMLCIGCPINAFHTVAEACAAHGVDEACFTADLIEAAVGGERADTG